MFDGLADALFGWIFDLLYILQKSVCVIIDFIVDIFYRLAGLESVQIDGKDSDLLSYFVSSNGVRTAFFSVFLIGIILLCIFVIIAIIRSEYADGNQKKTKAQILTKAFHAFLIFLIIPFLLAAGIMLTNVVVGAINSGMTLSVAGGGKPSFGGQILVTSGNGAFIGKASERAAIEGKFLNGQLDYNNLDTVKKYYDLHEMNFFVGIASGLIILVLFALSAIKFIQRIFDIILLYIISPVSISTIPLDDGQRFKLWREMLVSKVLGAYGIVLSMNLFFLIIPQVSGIKFFSDGFRNGIVMILFLIGGAFAVAKANMVISQLTGNNAGGMEAQQMLAGVNSGIRMARSLGHGAAAIAGRMIGGSDFRSNQKKGSGFGNSISAAVKSTRNQRVIDGKSKDKKATINGKPAAKPTAGQTATNIAKGAGRLATLPVGILKDAVQGGAVTAGKNFWARVKNVATGDGIINRAEVVRKHAEKSVEKLTETSTEKTEKGFNEGGGI